VPVLVEVEPPAGLQRVPVDICMVVDISGSMGNTAQIQSSTGQVESHGLNLLDIAKHGVRTIIEMLGEKDRISIVWFDDQAGLALPLTAMNADGKKKANEAVSGLHVAGGTDIWRGLECGLNAFKADPDRMAHLMLLTDGQTCNRESVMSNLREYQQKFEQLPCTISTFGFGYNIDSQLLVDLATFGSATYSFIPDSGFVGTVFVHTLSNLLVTFAREVVVQLEATDCEIRDVRGHYGMEKTCEGARVKLGTMQYQQRRSLVVMVRPSGSLDASPALGANRCHGSEPHFLALLFASDSSSRWK